MSTGLIATSTITHATPASFAAHNIEIADLSTRRYAAAHSGSPMFAIQMTINVPGSVSISRLRDEFLELSDQMNLDAIIEPVKS